ncbi:MAG: carboxyvinyl-carboxyphosphonate phosphorylmutase [Actinomycetia bacterium]|nr:carboxyvinyl-carboxyphosphonate phosphorylmutase [Actinomycetes bacterium]
MSEQRDRFGEAIRGGTVLAPLTLDPLTARLVEQLGFEAGYLSGGALGFRYAVSEALLTITEIADEARRITNRSGLALIVDGGVGFGDAVHTARAIWEIEATGAVAIEIEDQVAPKRVHHHVGVEHLVPVGEMVGKITAAAEARRDDGFLIIARTGGIAHEGLEAGTARLRAYREAGADLLMALCGDRDAAAVAQATDAPLATITSFDRHAHDDWDTTPWSLVIDAFTGQALSITTQRDAYTRFRRGEPAGGPHDGMALHRELVELCGLTGLLAIERSTTESDRGLTPIGLTREPDGVDGSS